MGDLGASNLDGMLAGTSARATGATHTAPIAYDEAIRRIEAVARQHSSRLPDSLDVPRRDHPCRTQCRGQTVCAQNVDAKVKNLPLISALGERCAQAISAPHSIPTHDTSAMDGFAVSSDLTVSASKEQPVRLRISHVIAAGDGIDTPIQKKADIDPHSEGHAVDGECVEIMTGARFPELSHPDLDAVVKIEDVFIKKLECDWDCDSEYIEVFAPIRRNQNRRFAGSDLVTGAPIIDAGETIEPKHIMALASVGIRDVKVAIHDRPKRPCAQDPRMSQKHIKIGVMSTGSELTDVFDNSKEQESIASSNLGQGIPNSNGPYIMSRLRQLDPSLEIQYLGVVHDSEAALEDRIRQGVCDRELDVMIATGGVSMGKFDLVRPVLERRMQAKVVFHGVKVRPGLPVLFALLEHTGASGCLPKGKMTAFFGLPGNPIATAMALRFFVILYLGTLGNLDVGSRGPPRVLRLPRPTSDRTSEVNGGLVKPTVQQRAKPSHLNVFWLSKRRQSCESAADNRQGVEILEDQASFKMGSLIRADCWTEIRVGIGAVSDGDLVIVHQL